jgi:heterodisulfide reductase subunit A
MLEQANIREQVSWTHTHNHDAATYKAKNLVAAAVAKAELLEPLKPIRVKTVQNGIVIGGGVAGLRVARDLSHWGMKVDLVEKNPFLGGHMPQLNQVFPSKEEARDLLNQLIQEVTNDPNITIHCNSQVIDGGGSLGDYFVKIEKVSRGCSKQYTKDALEEITRDLPLDIDNKFDYGLTKRHSIWLPYQGCWPFIPAVDWEHFKPSYAEKIKAEGFDFKRESEIVELRGGSIILATGFRSYEPFQGEYGYGKIPEVITLPQLIRLMAKDGPTGGNLEINGHSVHSVAFIHCVGSRQMEGINEPQPDGKVNDYCSRSCCTATLQAANELKEHYPDLVIYDLYQDIRTYGRGHEDYYQQASKNGVLFIRYDPTELATVESANNGECPVTIIVNDQLTNGEALELNVDLVVLSVGMMPRDISGLLDIFKLPQGADRFLQEVHPKLRPVELAVEGIMLAGSCQGPMDITEATAAASAAAAKSMNILSQEYVELNPYIARVDLEICSGNGLCVEECSEAQAISLENGKAKINATLCNGCGMCVAVCPSGAINIQGWTIPQFKSMVTKLLAQVQELA